MRLSGFEYTFPSQDFQLYHQFYARQGFALFKEELLHGNESRGFLRLLDILLLPFTILHELIHFATAWFTGRYGLVIMLAGLAESIYLPLLILFFDKVYWPMMLPLAIVFYFQFFRFLSGDFRVFSNMLEQSAN